MRESLVLRIRHRGRGGSRDRAVFVHRKIAHEIDALDLGVVRQAVAERLGRFGGEQRVLDHRALIVVNFIGKFVDTPAHEVGDIRLDKVDVEIVLSECDRPAVDAAVSAAVALLEENEFAGSFDGKGVLDEEFSLIFGLDQIVAESRIIDGVRVFHAVLADGDVIQNQAVRICGNEPELRQNIPFRAERGSGGARLSLDQHGGGLRGHGDRAAGAAASERKEIERAVAGRHRDLRVGSPFVHHV